MLETLFIITIKRTLNCSAALYYRGRLDQIPIVSLLVVMCFSGYTSTLGGLTTKHLLLQDKWHAQKQQFQKIAHGANGFHRTPSCLSGELEFSIFGMSFFILPGLFQMGLSPEVRLQCIALYCISVLEKKRVPQYYTWLLLEFFFILNLLFNVFLYSTARYNYNIYVSIVLKSMLKIKVKFFLYYLKF